MYLFLHNEKCIRIHYKKDTNRVNMKGWKKIFHANSSNKRRVRVAALHKRQKILYIDERVNLSTTIIITNIHAQTTESQNI